MRLPIIAHLFRKINTFFQFFCRVAPQPARCASRQPFFSAASPSPIPFFGSALRKNLDIFFSVKYYFLSSYFPSCHFHLWRKRRQKVAFGLNTLCKLKPGIFLAFYGKFSLGKTLWNLGKTMLPQWFFPIFTQPAVKRKTSKSWGQLIPFTNYVPDLFLFL